MYAQDDAVCMTMLQTGCIMEQSSMVSNIGCALVQMDIRPIWDRVDYVV